jgi:RND superfamily putative drug exporter
VLERLAQFCYRRRGRVLIGWIVVLIALNVLANAVQADYRANQSLPDSESKDVQDLLEKASPNRAGYQAQIVFRADQGVEDPAVRNDMESLFATVDKLEGVDVVSPYALDGERQVSDNGRIGFAELNISDRDYQEAVDLGDKIEAIGKQHEIDGVTIEYGGDLFGDFQLPESEALGLLAAVIILLIAFGSVLAMGLPIGTALFGLGTGVALTMLLSNVQSMPDFAPQLTAMIGLGVGIDYALFIVTRYRDGLHAGLDNERAVMRAVDTSGRAVLFAGATVILSLLGLYIMGLAFVSGLATGAALGVVTMMVAAVTLLPALIGFAGNKIEVTRYRGIFGFGSVTLGLLLAILLSQPIFAVLGIIGLVVILVGSKTFAPGLAREVPHRRQKPREQQAWYRWSRVIQHRPWPAFAVGLIVLLVLAIPVLGIRLGFGDTGNLNRDQTPRRAYDMLAEGFGPGFNGPFIVTVTGNAASDDATLSQFRDELAATKGVAAVSEPVPINDNLSLVQVYPTSAPQDEETTQLVHRLRDDVIPATGVSALVGGINAASVDFAGYLGDRLPLLIGAVLVLSFLLLMVVFRSLLVPLKAVIMNLLSIGAAYGVVVAVFQWGWGAGIIGVEREGPIDAWVPMMLFAIVFGLSMDYEVFLLSRMKEEYDRTRNNATAVADGLASTARVITAAALIMVAVFSAFVLGDDRALKLFGLGLAVAVLIDATVVRMVLVPATMELLGDRNWYIPKWLDRILPRVHIEGRRDEEVEERAQEEELVGAGRE